MKAVRLASSTDCTGCAACANACQRKSIAMRSNKFGFLEPQIDYLNCVGCHNCERACPIINPSDYIRTDKPLVYSATIKDKSILSKSTSGGAFYTFASYVISMGGAVFGARFEDYHVRHDYGTTIPSLYEFMGSKYVQSAIGDCYEKVKSFLERKIPVLFSGTPCQVAGLNQYLQKEYDCLYTISLICRGVPSPQVWESYFSKLKKKKGFRDIKNLRFRSKSSNFSSPVPSYVLSFSYSDRNGESRMFCEDCRKNPYFSYFMNHIFRSSCLRCQFRNTYRSGADITIGDSIICISHGGDNSSTIVLHSNKAIRCWNSVKDQMRYKEIGVEILNDAYEKSIQLQKMDRQLRAWKLSNRLALLFPLGSIRWIYERQLLILRALRLLKRWSYCGVSIIL